MRRIRHNSALSLVLAVAAVAGCSTGSSHDVPRDWIKKEYGNQGIGYRDPRDQPTRVADEIEDHRSARDRVWRDGNVFLRYRNDIVAVTPDGTGSRIEIESYDRGHQRWSGYVGGVWPAPERSGGGFRGGGPGSGK